MSSNDNKFPELIPWKQSVGGNGGEMWNVGGKRVLGSFGGTLKGVLTSRLSNKLGLAEIIYIISGDDLRTQIFFSE